MFPASSYLAINRFSQTSLVQIIQRQLDNLSAPCTFCTGAYRDIFPCLDFFPPTRNSNFHPGIETTAVGVAQVDRPKPSSSRQPRGALRSILLQPKPSSAPTLRTTTRRNARIVRPGIETSADGAAQVDRPNFPSRRKNLNLQY